MPGPATRLQHDGIFYDDESDFVETVVPFIRDGVEAGEVVMVNTVTHPVTPLLRAMFAGEEQVRVADRAVYSTPAAALDGYRRTMEQGLAQGAVGYRAVGFIDFQRTHLPWQEWLRYEAAVNRVFADLPFRTICPYDVTEVPAPVVEAIRSAHTGLVGPEGRRLNEGYVDPAALVVRDGLVTPPHPLQSTAPRMVLEPGDDLDDLRMEVYSAVVFSALPRRRVDDFVSAVAEVVANAHRHAGPPVRLRLWASDGAMVCTVTDPGGGIADPLAGYARPTDPSQGLGLWAARQLVDVLDFDRTPEGFTVRVAALG